NVSSLAGRSKSANGGPAYSASKAGLLGLTRHLAFDYGPRGVRVNAICPGGVDTPMIRAGGVRRARSEAEAQARVARIAAYEYFMPIKRLSRPGGTGGARGVETGAWRRTSISCRSSVSRGPREQAAAIAFLASDDASYINGVALDVTGGLYTA